MGKIQSIVAMARGGGETHDPDRLALAVAINSASEARRAVDAAAASRGRALRMVDQAEDRLAAATSAVTEAKDSLARRMTSYATEGGTALAPDSILSNCRAEERDAADNLDAARAALNAVEATLEGPLDALRASEKRVSELSRVILGRHIEAAVSDVARLATALSSARATLWFLHRECHQWPPTPDSERVRFAFTYMPELDLSLNNQTAARWAEYLAALKLDADAAPPSI
jgi:hypothetical protein